MENFNLKKFLTENKLTTNSRMLKEDIGEVKTYLGVESSGGMIFML
jgi:hypothetical protein